ncbi:MAG: gamma-glutamyltransferase, partial [Hyphomicrobiales bacterium]|nr:gamma-glutamyltransferase [Hyphomicrobiales bacterium]
QLWGQDPQVAVDAPRWRVMEGLDVACEPAISDDVLERLVAMGHRITLEAPDSAFGFGGGQIIRRSAAGGYIAGSDPRKDGAAAGF